MFINYVTKSQISLFKYHRNTSHRSRNFILRYSSSCVYNNKTCLMKLSAWITYISNCCENIGTEYNIDQKHNIDRLH